MDYRAFLKHHLPLSLLIVFGGFFAYQCAVTSDRLRDSVEKALADPCREADGSFIYYDLKVRVGGQHITSGSNETRIHEARVPQCQCVGKEFMETLGAMCVERHRWKE